MKDIAMHILDITQNSVRAKADKMLILLNYAKHADTLDLTISDNGTGMEAKVLQNVTDPFTTTRTSRKMGMGLPLLKQNAEQTGGSLEIISKQGTGTHVLAHFKTAHIDMPDWGDIAGTICMLMYMNPAINIEFEAKTNHNTFHISTNDIKAQTDNDFFENNATYNLVKELIFNNLEDIKLNQ